MDQVYYFLMAASTILVPLIIGGFVVQGIVEKLRAPAKLAAEKREREEAHARIRAAAAAERARLAALSLSDDEYRLFLAKEYKIAKHEAFDQFQVGRKLFPSLNEALKFADQQFRTSLA